jgi:hypothetical protein
MGLEHYYQDEQANFGTVLAIREVWVSTTIGSLPMSSVLDGLKEEKNKVYGHSKGASDECLSPGVC